MNTKIMCSVGILTFNSESTLSKCLDSVKDFSEIIICDGGSTDKTLEIAQEYECKVIFQNNDFKYDNGKISDFSAVRNQTIKEASNKWFLHLDSDEYLSRLLIEEIRDVVVQENTKVFMVPRKYVINGLVVDCATSYPSYQTRLFNLDFIQGFSKKVHEKLIVNKDVIYGKLKESIMVPLVIKKTDFIDKHSYYLRIEKAKMSSLKKKDILIGFFSCFRNIASWMFRLLKSRITCRGRQMPFLYDWLNIRYNLILLGLFVQAFFKVDSIKRF